MKMKCFLIDYHHSIAAHPNNTHRHKFSLVFDSSSLSISYLSFDLISFSYRSHYSPPHRNNNNIARNVYSALHMCIYIEHFWWITFIINEKDTNSKFAEYELYWFFITRLYYKKIMQIWLEVWQCDKPNNHKRHVPWCGSKVKGPGNDIKLIHCVPGHGFGLIRCCPGLEG